MQSVQVIAITFSLSILIAIVDLIRRGRLKEQYSLLWLASSGVLLFLSIWRGLLDKMAQLVGVAYPPSLLFLIAFIFLLLIVLHFSVIISSLSEKNKKLAQEIGLLKALIEKKRFDAERSDD
ncbi:MAG: DUF2304 domain-containing protein [Deltaproteobacteria bacterium]|nr:DUF2304 domain-containing protein [Deltaproteobacteria bacterium]